MSEELSHSRGLRKQHGGAQKMPEFILLACISEEQYRNNKLNQNFRKILQVN